VRHAAGTDVDLVKGQRAEGAARVGVLQTDASGAAAKGQIEELGEVQLVRSGAGVRAQRYVPDGPPATDRTGPH
jgi:hypothetical protein